MKIKSSGHVLLNLINESWIFLKIENDKLQLKEAPADLNELTEEFRELFRPAMMQGELDFEIQRMYCIHLSFVMRESCREFW